MKEKERDRVKETERDAKQARFFLVRRGNVKEPCLVWKRARRREGAFDKTATNRGVKRDGRERPSLCLSLVKRISCGELWARIHASVTSTRLRARSRLTKRGEEKRRRSTVSSRQARLASTMLRPWVLTVSHPSGREHTRTRVPPTARYDPTKRERERECVGWPAGRFARSLARSLTRTRSAETCSGSELFYFLGDYFYLVRIARTQAGEQASRPAGCRVALCRAVPAPILPEAGPSWKLSTAGRPHSRHKNSILLRALSSHAVLSTAPSSFPRFPSRFVLLSRSFTRPSRVSSLPPSLLTLSSPFLSL